MGWHSRIDDDGLAWTQPPDDAPASPPQPPHTNGASPIHAAPYAAPAPPPPPPPAPAPTPPAPAPPPAVVLEPVVAAPAVFAPAPEAAVATLSAPAVANGDTPAYILALAERTTQVVRGTTRGAWLTFGFYPDGNIRMVDTDGGCYEGRSVSARAEMREAFGSRSFLLQIGVAADGRLQATFSGGLHDRETLVLESVTERPLA